jgi:hypothetical protein
MVVSVIKMDLNMRVVGAMMRKMGKGYMKKLMEIGGNKFGNRE